MSAEVSFWFYVAAAVCFVLAALGEGWKYGMRSRSGLAPRLVLLPLGLFLWLFPLLWTTGKAAY